MTPHAPPPPDAFDVALLRLEAAARTGASATELAALRDELRALRAVDANRAAATAWMAAATEDDPTDLAERRDRFLEEAVEAVQALGGSAADARSVVDYVFSRPVGEPGPELGAAQATLDMLAAHARVDLPAVTRAELARISTPEAVAKVRRKRATRHGRGPLPGLDVPADADRAAAR